jgi:hypothetical protein
MGARSLFRILAAAPLAAALVVSPITAEAGNKTSVATTANPAPWDVVAAPNPEAGGAQLAGVAAINPSDAWAVGPGPSPYSPVRTLTEHWDGQAWSIVPSPNPAGASSAWLEGVAAASSSDVWAVGAAKLTSGATQTLIERWNGSSWTIVSSPNNGTSSQLHDVEVVSDTDVWAVGESSSGSMIIRWNGSKWNVVTNPCSFALHGITAISSNDVWAVGYQHACHWDGQAWSKVVVDPYEQTTIVEVSGVATNDVWAVGTTWLCPYDCSPYGFIRHWDGAKWTVFVFEDDMFFRGVKAVSPTEVYAVGQDCCGRTLIFLWNGRRWRQAPNPEVNGSLSDVAASSASDLWAVGRTHSAGPPTTLAERAPSPTSGGVMGNTGVSGATVSWFGPESGSTQSDADYAIGGLSPGSYDLIASAPGCDPARASVTVSVGVTLTQDFALVC